MTTSVVLYVGVACVGLGMLTVLLMLVPRPQALSPADRVTAYTRRTAGLSEPLPVDAVPVTAERFARARGASESFLGSAVGLEARIAAKLEAAGSALKPAEWLLIHLAVMLGVGLLGGLLLGSALVALLLLVLGAIGPWVFLGLKVSRRRKAFDAALADTLQLISGSLSAGLSLAQSVDTITHEGQEPMVSEFKRALVETRLGVDLEDALEGVATRLESRDFAWVVMAVRIQREVGGNLAELLDTVAGTLRERQYLRRQVASLSAEGRLSAFVLGGLPPVFLVYLTLTNGTYVAPLFNQPVGWLLLAIAGTLLGLGILWMAKLVKMEV